MEKKLAEIVKYAYEETEYYHNLYDKNRINLSKCKFEDLPLISSSDLILHNELFCSSSEPIFRISSSSGTSKHPKSLYRTIGDYEASVELMTTLLLESGLSNKDKVYIGQPFDLATFGYLVLDGCKKIGALAIPGGLGQSNERMLDLIFQYNANVIMSSPSRIKVLSELVDMLYSSYERERLISNIDKIILAGEPLCTHDKIRLMKFWKCEILNYYGSEETDSLGYSAAKSEDIVLLRNGFYFEFIPVNSEVFELVVTSLYHRGTPLIRYRLGDLIKYIGRENNCHKIQIIGKSVDVVNLFDGVKLYAYQVEDLIKHYVKNYINFQIICQRKENYDYVKVLIKTSDQNRIYSDIERELENKVWDCSLDLNVCKEIGSVRFDFLINKEDYQITRRGKVPRVIDLREEQSSCIKQ